MRKRKTVSVEEVVDGDTFVTDKGQKIRIASVNTPEKGHPGAAQAKRYLKGQIDGESVVVSPVARDRYGRTVANVYKDGKSIGQKLRKKGW